MITANQHFNRLRLPGADHGGRWEVHLKQDILPLLATHGIPDQGYDLTGKPLLAYVNHGRWLVKCECGGCEYYWQEGWFFCMSCLNSAHGHKYRHAARPRNAEAIERLLNLRPVLNRNWLPDETISQLKAENSAHSAELLGGIL